jgi:hypothetical protein
MDTIEVVNAIRDGNRVQALDKIADILYGKAAEAMKDYKQTVAQTFFDQPETPEEEVEETPAEEPEQ